MAVPSTGTVGEKKVEEGGRWKKRLSNLIDDWKELREKIEDYRDWIDDQAGNPEAIRQGKVHLNNLHDNRRHLVNQITSIAEARDLKQFAINQGFRASLFGSDAGSAGSPSGTNAGESKAPTTGGGTPDTPGPDRDRDRDRDKDKPNLKGQAADNRLLGDKGKDYDIVRGPKGSYVARYKFKIDGETFHIGVRIPKSRLARYGIKEGEGKQLTAAQMKRIKNIGWADALAPHIRKGDSNVMKSLVRSLNVQYEGQSILNNDGVMSKVIGNSLFGWSAAEFENQLRTTKWYKNTNAYQREFVTTVSPEEKKERQKLYLERVVNKLEDVYGLDWTKHVQGGMGTARGWAQKIASGRWGEPGEGFEFWYERQFDRAAKIEGTNAWIEAQKEQEERRGYLNRPEEMFEQLRSQALAYLGYDKRNTPRIARSDLQNWADMLVSGERSEGDWAKFLRRQMKTLHPYFDPNLSFTEQASAYKSIAERTLGDTLDWNDRLLRDFTRLDASGNPTDKPMSLHDYELKVRQDNRAWKEGTALWEEGLGIVQALENTFLGVG